MPVCKRIAPTRVSCKSAWYRYCLANREKGSTICTRCTIEDVPTNVTVDPTLIERHQDGKPKRRGTFIEDLSSSFEVEALRCSPEFASV